MNEKILQHPILEHGIRNINFFEGRLLTGEDLREQQKANREHDNRLGKAIGAGIIEGLEVGLVNDGADGSAAVVKVKQGMAINAKGEIFGLPKNDIDLFLSEIGKVINIDQADFNNCTKLPGSQLLPNAARVYILVMSPAAGYTERAPKSGLGDDGVVKGCGSRYIQEGVEFRLVELTVEILLSMHGISEWTKSYLEKNLVDEPVTKLDIAGISKLRNVLAHLCFGTEQLNNFSVDPFDTRNALPKYSSYGVFDALWEQGELNDCDVPLALLYRSVTTMAFCDIYSVRRTPYSTGPSTQLSMPLEDRRSGENKALHQQFQEQIQWLLDKVDVPSEIGAEVYFKWLPPVGFLKQQRGTDKGIHSETFFQELPHRPAPPLINDEEEFRNNVPQFIDGNKIESLLTKALNFPPIDIESKEMVWIYHIWQNVSNIENGGNKDHYMIFVSGLMEPVETARFDVARWGFSNYVKCCDGR